MDTPSDTGTTTGSHDAIAVHERRPCAGDAVLIVDVDQFAAIRAAHGCPAGEQVTRAVADALRRRLRRADRIALLRDDEFLAVLPGTPEHALPEVVSRVRDAIGTLRLALAGRIWGLSCTIGAAAREGGGPCGLEGLVRAADTELHRVRCAARRVAG
jgi:diguanylate cyclase (GGDEF)-like protein